MREVTTRAESTLSFANSQKNAVSPLVGEIIYGKSNVKLLIYGGWQYQWPWKTGMILPSFAQQLEVLIPYIARKRLWKRCEVQVSSCFLFCIFEYPERCTLSWSKNCTQGFIFVAWYIQTHRAFQSSRTDWANQTCGVHSSCQGGPRKTSKRAGFDRFL